MPIRTRNLPEFSTLALWRDRYHCDVARCYNRTYVVATEMSPEGRCKTHFLCKEHAQPTMTQLDICQSLWRGPEVPLPASMMRENGTVPRNKYRVVWCERCGKTGCESYYCHYKPGTYTSLYVCKDCLNARQAEDMAKGTITERVWPGKGA